MLRLMAFAAVSGGIALLGSGFLLNSSRSMTGQASQAKASVSLVPAIGATGDSVASLRVKVMYFQMSNYVSTKEEYFVLQSPATFSNLLANVVEKHPVLSSMTPSMLILIDGVPAKPETSLNDGDEVDFVPSTSGG